MEEEDIRSLQEAWNDVKELVGYAPAQTRDGVNQVVVSLSVALMQHFGVTHMAMQHRIMDRLHNESDEMLLPIFQAADKDEFMQRLVEAFLPSSEELSSVEVALQEQFESDYNDPNGFILAYLLRFIDGCFEQWASSTKSWYAPCAPIIQSSGWGKSRAIRELAIANNQLVVFYFTLMKRKSSGYPRSHVDIHHHFSKISKPEHAYAVFSACFKLVSEAESFPDKALLFQKHQTRHYDDVLERLKQHPTCSLQEMQHAYRAALNKFGECLRSAGVQFLFVVDEARGLLQDQSKMEKKGESAFVIFRRACKDLPIASSIEGRKAGSFVLFIDTNAKVSNFSPSRTEDSSARVIRGTQKLFGPLSRLPTFNLFSDSQHSQLDKIAAPEVLFKHGRPLWAASKFDNKPWEEGVIDFAQEKLLGGLSLESQEGKLKLEDANMALAFLGRRIAVDVSAQSSSAQVLVASHMRVCLHTSADRDYVLTQALPEPILAEAAARLLRKDENLLKQQLKQVNSLLLNGIASAGERGELVARFLLLNAMDTLQDSGGFTSPQGLEKFLMALIPGWKGFASESTSHLRQAKVFFNAFYPFFGDPTIKDIMKFARKAGAMLCKQGTEAFDLYIPLLFPGYDLNDDNCIGCLGIQVKNRKQLTGSIAAMNKMKARQKSLASKGNQVVPNILMLLQLGTQDSEGSKSEEAPVVSAGESSKAKEAPVVSAGESSKAKEAPVVSARGSSEKKKRKPRKYRALTEDSAVVSAEGSIKTKEAPIVSAGGSSKKKKRMGKKERARKRAKTEDSAVLVKETFSEVSFILESRSALLVPKHLCEVVTTLLCERPQPLLILEGAGVDEMDIRALKQIMQDMYPADATVTKGDADTQISARVYTRRRK